MKKYLSILFVLAFSYCAFSPRSSRPHESPESPEPPLLLEKEDKSWETVGTAGFSDSRVYCTSFAIAPNGTPYIAYENTRAQGVNDYSKIVVMKFENGSWVTVGYRGYPSGSARIGRERAPSLVIDSNNVPYIAYASGTWRSHADPTATVIVMKYNSTSAAWEDVGKTVFSAGEAARENHHSLAIDNNDNLYLAYSDSDGLNGGKATVKKYDSATTSWRNVGNPGFSAGKVYCTSLEIDSNNVPYIAYVDVANNDKATVMKYNSVTGWENVGNPGFSVKTASYLSLAISPTARTPYLVYNDGETMVKKWNGSRWENVGNLGITTGSGHRHSLAIDSNDVPYIAYKDGDNGQRATVKKFENNSWILVGTKGFNISLREARYLSVAINDGTPYVAYKDLNSVDIKGTVKKLLKK